MSKTNPKVDGYIRKSKQWQAELQALRSIVLDRQLTEEVKWRVPCYTLDKKIVLFIGRLKESCVLSFVKGALLKDPNGILIQQTKNTQGVRIIRFASVQEITRLAPVLKTYIDEAIAVEKAGLKIPFKKVSEFSVPEEFQTRLEKVRGLKTAFEKLTPGRQRGYLLYFSGAKQSTTRTARIEKCVPRILEGKGLEDA